VRLGAEEGRLVLTNRRASRGFTITEMLVAIGIVAVLLGLGAPSVTGYVEAAKLNGAAQAYLAGIQTARATAIRQNLRAEFILTNTPMDTANLADVVVPAPNGQNWVVRVVDPTLPPPAWVLVDSRSSNEGAVTTAQSVQIAGVAAPTAFNGILPFDGFGNTVGRDNYTFSLQNPRGGACAPAGPMRCPQIRVPAGGLARICDPQVLAATDSRGC
jgi:type IV fimbrial biogenesis protein FimT